MKYQLIVLIFWTCSLFSQTVDSTYLSICSWNIQNFGKSKSREELLYISKVVKNYDIVAIQEVSTSDWGAKSVATLDDFLDRTGSKWDYVVSNPTSGEGSERYAYLFKTSRVKLKNCRLLTELESEICREPFFATFIFSGKELNLYNIHIVPTQKKPELEILKLSNRLIEIKERNIILGDFNLGSQHVSFTALKKSHNVCFKNEPTSLKKKPDSSQNVLNLPYDNFFVEKSIKTRSCEVIHFWKDFVDFNLARQISDHCPIKLEVK